MNISYLFYVVGLLLMALSIPMIRRKIAPNLAYGLRIRATFADEWVWYEANARSGRDLFIIGLGICVLAFVLPLLPGITAENYPLVLSGITLFAVLVAVFLNIRFANRLLEQRKASGEELKPHDPLSRASLRFIRRK